MGEQTLIFSVKSRLTTTKILTSSVKLVKMFLINESAKSSGLCGNLGFVGSVGP